ncbi:MAG TPA: right-handed parallel beta-helix repeat-containing protein [Pseudonocardia sp.]
MSAPGAGPAPAPGVTAPAARITGRVPEAGPAKTGCGPANHPVRDAGGLTQALSGAQPGDVLALADGVYRGNFTARAQGSAARPITLCGGRNAVLLGSAGYTLHLDGAAHWRVAGFTIRGGQKGLVADHAEGNVLENLVIEQVGQEGLHLRAASSDNTVRDNDIQRTGLTDAQFGEGIYVGSARQNWPKFGGGGPDRSDRNVVAGNTVTDVAAECVDIKEGTTGGVLRGNTFSGRALRGAYADSWVDVKGNRWLIADNVGSDSPVDGYQVHEILAGWGVDNRFTHNTSNLGAGTGFAINVTRNPTRTVVGCDNKVTGGRGVTNVTCTNNTAPA